MEVVFSSHRSKFSLLKDTIVDHLKFKIIIKLTLNLLVPDVALVIVVRSVLSTRTKKPTIPDKNYHRFKDFNHKYDDSSQRILT